MKISKPSSIIWTLTGLNLFNYVDRYVAVSVAPSIKEQFALSDFQAGAIISAFMLGYFVTSPVFGALGDRMPRKGLIAAGVLVWSLATAVSGLAAGFVALIAARVVVGIGEASYATLSPTIIDDVTTPATKNRWLAVFYMAIPVGTALGYSLGGMFPEAEWHRAFFFAGLPGIALAALCLLIVEPERKRHAAAKIEGAFAKLASLPTYRTTVLGYTAYTFALGAFAGVAPLFLYRYYGQASGTGMTELKLWFGINGKIWLGLVLAGGGFVGTAIGGWLGDRAAGADRAKAYLRVCALVTAAAVPFSALALLAKTPGGFFASFAVASVLLFTSTAPTNAAILKSVPEELRASAMAVSIFVIHLFGDFVSPSIVGLLSDAIGSLRIAMLMLPAMIALGALLWWWGSLGAEKAPVAEAGS